MVCFALVFFVCFVAYVIVLLRGDNCGLRLVILISCVGEWFVKMYSCEFKQAVWFYAKADVFALNLWLDWNIETIASFFYSSVIRLFSGFIHTPWSSMHTIWKMYRQIKSTIYFERPCWAILAETNSKQNTEIRFTTDTDPNDSPTVQSRKNISHHSHIFLTDVPVWSPQGIIMYSVYVQHST